MPHAQFPCHYVYWVDVENHETLKTKYLPIIENMKNINMDNRPFPQSRFNTNYSKFMDFLNVNDIENIVWTPIQKMINEIPIFKVINLNRKKLHITNYWYNNYNEHDNQEIHTHAENPKIINGKMYHPMFSLVYILNDPHNNSIVFNTGNTCEPYKKPFRIDNMDTADFENIKDGTVLIFSSFLPHYVNTVKGNNRTTIAFNIFYDFD